jgi:hypothetical protein
MNLILRPVAIAFIAIFAFAVWTLVGIYVGQFVPFSKAGELNW